MFVPLVPKKIIVNLPNVCVVARSIPRGSALAKSLRKTLFLASICVPHRNSSASAASLGTCHDVHVVRQVPDANSPVFSLVENSPAAWARAVSHPFVAFLGNYYLG